MSTALILLVAVVAAARGTWSPCGLSMVSAINPLSERSRGNRYWLTTLWFVAGAGAGGAVLGLAGFVLALALTPLSHHLGVSAALGSAGCLVALAADRRVGGFHLPLHARQVNEEWLMRYRRWLYAAGFGFQIGTGFATYIMTAATYLLVLLSAVSGSPSSALGAGLLFGLVRGAAVVLSSRCRTPQALLAVHRRLSELETTSLRVVMAVEIIAAVGLAAAASGRVGVAVVAVTVALIAAGPVLTARASAPRLSSSTPARPVKATDR
jgi:MFS family permease